MDNDGARRIGSLAGHDSGMLWALRFVAGLAEPIDDPAAPPRDGWTWTHFPLSDVRARAFLSADADLPGAVRALIAGDDRRMQVNHQGGWAYGVLPDLERNLDGEALEPGRLVFACDGRRLVTARLHALRAIDDVRRQAEAGAAIESPAQAVARFVLQYLDVVETQVEGLAADLDLIEDRVLDERIDLDGRRLGPLRRRLASHRRELAGLRSALNRTLSPRDGRRAGFLATDLAVLAAPLDDLDREAASLQDRARLLHEEIDTLINSATNRSMRALTILSSLLIPPTLIVGAFGMNLEGIPMAHSRVGFFAAIVLCAAVVLGAYLMLKRMRLVP